MDLVEETGVSLSAEDQCLGCLGGLREEVTFEMPHVFQAERKWVWGCQPISDQGGG